MLAFQVSLLAVYGLLPPSFAFQMLVTFVVSGYCQFTDQPFNVCAVLFLIRIAPVKPFDHWLLITYVQLALGATDEEELVLLKELRELIELLLDEPMQLSE